MLYDGLAEHLLYELANDWYNIEHFNFHNIDATLLYDSLVCLMAASNLSLPNAINRCSKTASIDLLKSLLVGTQNFKKSPGPPNAAQLGPIVNLCLKTPTSKLAATTRRTMEVEVTKSNGRDNDNNEIQPTSLPSLVVNYRKISLCIIAIKEWFGNPDDIFTEVYIGYCLISLRENGVDITIDERLLYKEVKDLLDGGNVQHRIWNKEKHNNCGHQMEMDDVNDEAALLSSTTTTPYSPTRNCASQLCKKKRPTMARISCCHKEYNTTTTNTPLARFICLPRKPIPSSKNHNTTLLKQRYIQLFKRKEWLRHCKLSPTDERSFLRLCDNHVIQKENFTVIWYNAEGKKETSNATIAVPTKMTNNSVRTPKTTLNIFPLKAKQICMKRKMETRRIAVTNIM
jgi:hypothetical protein